MEIFDDILKTLGRTPLIHLKRFFPGKAVLAAKVESFNPGSSVKDRVGIAMIEAAEKSGKLKPGGKIVEPTSGNTGVGLAMAALLKGYKLICTASDKIPKEKVALLEAYGARVITCPASVAPEDPRSYYRVAEKIRDQEGAFLPNQYSNPANPEAHYRTTGPEIWKQTDGKITHWVTGIGTGGTISGTAKFLKEKNPEIRVIGIDIEGSVFEFFKEHGKMPPSENIHQYLTDGLGEDFIPDCVWWNYIDEVITVSDKTAYQTTLEVTRKEGIFCGSSGGAAAAGARKVAETLPGDALVVTLFPDSGERYLSKLNQTWLRKHNLLD
ncbi:MAG: cysteine synthase family protein [Acidobacteriota bacterium]